MTTAEVTLNEICIYASERQAKDGPTPNVQTCFIVYERSGGAVGSP